MNNFFSLHISAEPLFLENVKMSEDYKWENPNSKMVEYGGPFAGYCILWLCILFYPALVIAMQFGMTFFKSADTALFPSLFVGLAVLGIIWVLLQVPVLACRIFVICLYILCLGPFAQWCWFVGDEEYLESWEYEQRLEELGIEWDPCVSYDDWPQQAPFPGFNWGWWIEPCLDWIFTVLLPLVAVLLILKWILEAFGKS
jgi:hypothetical protein